MLKRGLTQIYTTSRGCFNFAPFGLALRAAGQELKVGFYTFTPHPLLEESKTFARWLHPQVQLDCRAIQPAGKEPALQGLQDPADLAAALERAREAMLAGRFDVVILNGIHDVVADGLIDLDRVLSLVAQRPVHVELVLSGADADFGIISSADLVTEMQALEGHPPSQAAEDSAIQADPLQLGGEVEIVTGRGKGKTTYCLGKASLLSARGVPGLVLQFIKSAQPYGEVRAISRLPHLEILTMGQGFPEGEESSGDNRHRMAARKAWQFLLRTLNAPRYGIVVLDEINIAVDYGFVEREQVIGMLSSRPADIHFFLSGRYASPEIMQAGTLALEMKEIKHPFRRGIKARRGIEF